MPSTITLSLSVGLSVKTGMSPVYVNNRPVAERGIPSPLADHPGNVDLDSETVRVAVPAEIPKETRYWQALDDKGHAVRHDAFARDVVSLPASIELGISRNLLF